MCGICVSIKFFEDDHQKLSNDNRQVLYNALNHRGPDEFGKTLVIYQNEICLEFISAVLHIRGKSLCVQPVRDAENNVLLWNGEIFGGPLAISDDVSDTSILAKKLFSCTKIDEIQSILKDTHGPYAFILYQNGYLWFGRDIFGRRSLLWAESSNKTIMLSSVSTSRLKWKEVPTTGIFCIDLNQSCLSKTFVITRHLWSSSVSGFTSKSFTAQNFSSLFEINDASIPIQSPIMKPLNLTLPSEDELRFIFNCNEANYSEIFDSLLSLPVIDDVLSRFENVLSESVKRRVQNQIYLCKGCYKLRASGSVPQCNHAVIGVLFSGGLDSMVIAHLVHRHLPADHCIDLINVAFATSKGHEISTSEIRYETPDRITGKKGVLELQEINSSRQWNFVEVNIPHEELSCCRKNLISDLLIPSHTVLDDSIGCALWFAARAKGGVRSDEGVQSYTSPAKILLVGMGADEQLAGYARHRKKFSTGGWKAVLNELMVELDNIGSRNLGRDDRIISDHGVEPRFPFLDENVVTFLNDTPIWLKVNFNYQRGVGEKLLLRLLAYKFGLVESAILPKRAIQFGSRIARMENSKEKGSDICERLTSVHS